MTDFFGGTSSATPLVAGIAALVISANPDLTALEVISILKRTASKDLDFTLYPRTPPASFDPNPSWDVSPIAPFNTGAFQNINDPDGTAVLVRSRQSRHEAAVAEILERERAPSPSIIRRPPSPALSIPDNNQTGAQDTINVTDSATIASIKSLYGHHPHVHRRSAGDAPFARGNDGRTARPQRRQCDNIKKTFDLTTTPGLSALKGQSVQGVWTLLIQDLAAVDVGRLNSWGLRSPPIAVWSRLKTRPESTSPTTIRPAWSVR